MVQGHGLRPLAAKPGAVRKTRSNPGTYTDPTMAGMVHFNIGGDALNQLRQVGCERQILPAGRKGVAIGNSGTASDYA